MNLVYKTDLRVSQYSVLFTVVLFTIESVSSQFYLLLGPYLCFISLLYLDLYVFGADALIS